MDCNAPFTESTPAVHETRHRDLLFEFVSVLYCRRGRAAYPRKCAPAHRGVRLYRDDVRVRIVGSVNVDRGLRGVRCRGCATLVVSHPRIVALELARVHAAPCLRVYDKAWEAGQGDDDVRADRWARPAAIAAEALIHCHAACTRLDALARLLTDRAARFVSVFLGCRLAALPLLLDAAARVVIIAADAVGKRAVKTVERVEARTDHDQFGQRDLIGTHGSKAPVE